MYNFLSGNELQELCSREDKPIWEIMLLREMEYSEQTRDELFELMKDNLDTMMHSVRKGLSEHLRSLSGLTGGDAQKLRRRYGMGHGFSGPQTLKAVAGAMAVLEVNASMGKIVAAPTAGSSGIIPGVLYAMRDERRLSDETLVEGLYTAAAIGMLITVNATVAGAEGGCQAETGAAAAMAAAALVEMDGGTPQQALHGAAIALKNVMGLVCDPIAGLVESPCIKRNAIGATNAMISADLACSGITSLIPFDEVVETMQRVGRAMHPNLKETARGGLAITPTGQRLAENVFSQTAGCDHSCGGC